MMKIYNLVNYKPVARFYYKGSHSHPVRRTVLIIEDKPDVLIGYEFRCGKTIRSRGEATSKVRSYKKDKIAKWGDYSRLQMTSKTFMKDENESTLERFTLKDFVIEGA